MPRKVHSNQRKCLVSFKESLSSFLLCSEDKLMSFPLETPTCWDTPAVLPLSCINTNSSQIWTLINIFPLSLITPAHAYASAWQQHIHTHLNTFQWLSTKLFAQSSMSCLLILQMDQPIDFQLPKDSKPTKVSSYGHRKSINLWTEKKEQVEGESQEERMVFEGHCTFNLILWHSVLPPFDPLEFWRRESNAPALISKRCWLCCYLTAD